MDKQNKINNTKKISPNAVAIIGALVIMLGGFFLTYNYIQLQKIRVYDLMAETLFVEVDEDGEEQPVLTPIEEEKEEEKPVINYVIERYIGYLKIPKIGLNKGFFAQDSRNNNVEKSIYIVPGSTMPDQDKGNFILAGHSGTGWKAFFNNLYKLNKGDEVQVEYAGHTYKYNIVNIYEQEKVGKIQIFRDFDKTTITLVTCTNSNDKTQTVYIAELTSIE